MYHSKLRKECDDAILIGTPSSMSIYERFSTLAYMMHISAEDELKVLVGSLYSMLFVVLLLSVLNDIGSSVIA